MVDGAGVLLELPLAQVWQLGPQQEDLLMASPCGLSFLNSMAAGYQEQESGEAMLPFWPTTGRHAMLLLPHSIG